MAQTIKDQARTSSLQGNASSESKERRTFFVAMASILVVIVAVGFAPSLYLRAFLHADQPGASHHALPQYLHLHGLVLSLWFLLFLAQTTLVATRRLHLHRLLGVFGAVLAVAVLSVSMLVLSRLVARSSSGAEPASLVAMIVTGDTGLLILFALFVAAGIRFRRRPDVHKRLMLLASITIVGPAIARWPGADALLPFSVLVPQLLLFIALMAYDFKSTRRIHPVSAWGTVLYIIVAAAATAAALTEFGKAFVKALL